MSYKEYASKDWVKENTVKSWNDLEDRPFYEEIGENILIQEMTLEGFAVVWGPIYAVKNPFTITLNFGQTYTVTWDGVGYDVECKSIDGIVYFGNENYVNMRGGGDIPFAVMFANDVIFVATESTAALHTISISTEATVHKIDEKYLPPIPPKEVAEVYDTLEQRDNFEHTYTRGYFYLPARYSLGYNAYLSHAVFEENKFLYVSPLIKPTLTKDFEANINISEMEVNDLLSFTIDDADMYDAFNSGGFCIFIYIKYKNVKMRVEVSNGSKIPTITTTGDIICCQYGEDNQDGTFTLEITRTA